MCMRKYMPEVCKNVHHISRGTQEWQNRPCNLCGAQLIRTYNTSEDVHQVLLRIKQTYTTYVGIRKT
jgi:hypothetical protein